MFLNTSKVMKSLGKLWLERLPSKVKFFLYIYITKKLSPKPNSIK